MAAPSATAGGMARFAPSPGRRRKDRFARAAILAATIVALVPLVLILYYLLKQGLSAWTGGGFFTTDPTGNTFFASQSIGGIKSAILGTIEIVALASLIAIPIGYLLDRLLIWMVKTVMNVTISFTFRFEYVALALGGTILLALLITLLPIRRAVRFRPGEALRYA